MLRLARQLFGLRATAIATRQLLPRLTFVKTANALSTHAVNPSTLIAHTASRSIGFRRPMTVITVTTPSYTQLSKQDILEQMRDMIIAVNGAGNLGGSYVEGLFRLDIPSSQILASSKSPQNPKFKRIQDFCTQVGNEELVRRADIIVLAAKPMHINSQCAEVAEHMRTHGIVHQRRTFVSVAAGRTINSIKTALGFDAQVIRIMPTLGLAQHKSVTGVYVPANIPSAKRDLVLSQLGEMGSVVLLKNEDALNFFTAVYGSGPGWFCRIIIFCQANIADEGAKGRLLIELQNTVDAMLQGKAANTPVWQQQLIECCINAALAENQRLRIGLSPDEIRRNLLLTLQATLEKLRSGVTPENYLPSVMTQRGTTEACVRSFENERTGLNEEISQLVNGKNLLRCTQTNLMENLTKNIAIGLARAEQRGVEMGKQGPTPQAADSPIHTKREFVQTETKESAVMVDTAAPTIR